MPRAARFTGLVALAVLLAVGWARAGDDEDTPEVRRKKIEAAKKARVEDERRFATQVNAAIDKGAKWVHEWLKQQQARGDGKYIFAVEPTNQDLGRLSLVLLTLVKCGIEHNDPAVKKGVQDALDWHVRQKTVGGGIYTYSVSLFLLMLDAYYNPPSGEPGDKRYAAPTHKKCKYPKEIEERIRELVAWLVEKQAENIWRYPGSLGVGPDQDLSNTQYALLALQAAGRCNIDAPAATYKKALEYLFSTQEPDGPEEPRWIENPAYEEGAGDRYGKFMPAGKAKARGWRYIATPDTAYTGSMTTAGVASLAIARERLGALGELDQDTKSKIDHALVDGMAWLAHNFTVEKNPGQGGWHYYYLYGLERVGAFTGLRYVGKHDWYREGAELLLKQQEPSGAWPWPSQGEGAKLTEQLIESCFALLFLRRATVPPAQPLGPVITGN
jgi:hypothetical protein